MTEAEQLASRITTPEQYSRLVRDAFHCKEYTTPTGKVYATDVLLAYQHLRAVRC